MGRGQEVEARPGRVRRSTGGRRRRGLVLECEFGGRFWGWEWGMFFLGWRGAWGGMEDLGAFGWGLGVGSREIGAEVLDLGFGGDKWVWEKMWV